jgi:single-strand DNA-binding protein
MINKTFLGGRVGNDPALKEFDNGGRLLNFSLATTEKYKNKQGETQETTYWHNIVIEGSAIDFVIKHVGKGDYLVLVGKVTYREYEKDGVKKWMTQIKSREITFLNKKKNQGEEINNNGEEKDDLPF